MPKLKKTFNLIKSIKKHKWKHGIILFLIIATMGVCIYLSRPVVNEPLRNFDSLWESFDRNYSNFQCKNIDWDNLYSIYRAKISPETTNRELFKIMIELLGQLDDKHVYIRKFNKVYFSGYGLSPLNYFQILKFDFRMPLKDFSLKLVKKKYIKDKLEKAFFVRQLAVPPFGFRHIFHYGWLDHSIAYIHISEMRNDKEKTEEVIKEIIDYFENPKAYIIDMRGNIGGYANPIKSLVGKFTDKPRIYAISYTRSGPNHDNFSEPQYKSIKPDEKIDLSHIPVLLLTNKNTQSAAELFTLMMGVLPNVTIVGDYTTGIFSDTHVDHLPNGWEYRLTIMKTTDHKDIWWEDKGIAPDIFIKNTKEDIERGVDRVLEKAIDLVIMGSDRI